MAKKQVDTAGKTENFFTRNVKLITFLICVAVILSPFVVTYIKDVIEEKRLEKRPDMTVEELYVIAQKGKDLSQRDLTKYEGYCDKSEMQGMKYAMYHIPITDRFMLSVNFDAEKDYLMTLNLLDLENQPAKLDLLTEADKLEDFLATPAN